MVIRQPLLFLPIKYNFDYIGGKSRPRGCICPPSLFLKALSRAYSKWYFLNDRQGGIVRLYQNHGSWGASPDHHVQPCQGREPEHLGERPLGPAEENQRRQVQLELQALPGLRQGTRRWAGHQRGAGGNRPQDLRRLPRRDVALRHRQKANG